MLLSRAGAGWIFHGTEQCLPLPHGIGRLPVDDGDVLERLAQLDGNVVETSGMALRRLFFHALDGEALTQVSTDHPDVQDPIKDHVRSGSASLSVSQGEVHYNLHNHHDQSHAWCPDAGCGADLV